MPRASAGNSWATTWPYSSAFSRTGVDLGPPAGKFSRATACRRLRRPPGSSRVRSENEGSRKATGHVFIDGANLDARAKTLNLDIDHKKLPVEFARGKQLLRAFDDTTAGEEEFSLRPAARRLGCNGFTAVTKPMTPSSTKQGIERPRGDTKGNTGSELAVVMALGRPARNIFSSLAMMGFGSACV